MPITKTRATIAPKTIRIENVVLAYDHMEMANDTSIAIHTKEKESAYQFAKPLTIT